MGCCIDLWNARPFESDSVFSDCSYFSLITASICFSSLNVHQYLFWRFSESTSLLPSCYGSALACEEIVAAIPGLSFFHAAYWLWHSDWLRCLGDWQPEICAKECVWISQEAKCNAKFIGVSWCLTCRIESSWNCMQVCYSWFGKPGL